MIWHSSPFAVETVRLSKMGKVAIANVFTTIELTPAKHWHIVVSRSYNFKETMYKNQSKV